MYKILLFYKYTRISDPKSLRDVQQRLCGKLGIKGRILVSKEGINGTVGGKKSSIKKYIEETSKIEGFSDIEWKMSESETIGFPKLRVLIRDEIVTLDLKRKGKDVKLKHKADYIEPNELLQMYEKGEDFIMIDARNEYESRIGKFKNAIVPDIDNFREFPSFVKKIESLKDKTIVTYCTGGIRCEKASAYLKEKGFRNVRQLHGGIHRYADTTGGKNFKGEMYVFDERVNIPVNKINPKNIAKCHHCNTQVSRYINCCNAECNLQLICCGPCDSKYSGGCSQACQENSRYSSI